MYLHMCLYVYMFVCGDWKSTFGVFLISHSLSLNVSSPNIELCWLFSSHCWVASNIGLVIYFAFHCWYWRIELRDLAVLTFSQYTQPMSSHSDGQSQQVRVQFHQSPTWWGQWFWRAFLQSMGERLPSEETANTEELHHQAPPHRAQQSRQSCIMESWFQLTSHFLYTLASPNITCSWRWK